MDRWASCLGSYFTEGIYFWFHHQLSCASASHELHCFWPLFFPPCLKKCPVPAWCLSPHSQGKVAGAIPRAPEGLENLHPFQWKGCFHVFQLSTFLRLFGIWSMAMQVHLDFGVDSLHWETFTSQFVFGPADTVADRPLARNGVSLVMLPSL